MKDSSGLEKTIGYVFSDKNLLRIALTHSSYASEQKLGYSHNNERLEFIGDAYIDAIVGTRLFEIMGNAHEGPLSKFRADVVCESALADTALRIGLGEYLYLGKGEDASGGRSKPSILSDAFEALMGAIMIDGGFEPCREVVLRLLNDKIEMAATGRLSRDFKTRLQEKIQEKDSKSGIVYKIVDEKGPDHNKIFTVRVSVNGRVIGTGMGSSKARAEQAAAKDALSKGVN
ncbi:MAG: ribonuclease III [Mogibacterium sp.]|nr:ribonuclease III [Mogibacterium sp.]